MNISAPISMNHTIPVPVKHHGCQTGLWKNHISGPKLLGRLQTPPFSRWVKYRHVLHGSCTASWDDAEQCVGAERYEAGVVVSGELELNIESRNLQTNLYPLISSMTTAHSTPRIAKIALPPLELYQQAQKTGWLVDWGRKCPERTDMSPTPMLLSENNRTEFFARILTFTWICAQTFCFAVCDLAENIPQPPTMSW